MLDKAIELIKKQRDMYVIQEKNIETKARKKGYRRKSKKTITKRNKIKKLYIENFRKPKKGGLKCLILKQIVLRMFRITNIMDALV